MSRCSTCSDTKLVDGWPLPGEGDAVMEPVTASNSMPRVQRPCPDCSRGVPNPGADAGCELCAFFGKECAATVRVTVPMAGEQPRYLLCDEHAADIDGYVERIETVVSDG